MEKSACEYVVPRGERKGQKCGNACVRKEGEEPRCFRHKQKYLDSKNINPHITKNQQLANLEGLSRTQQMQIQSIILELETCRAELAESSSMCRILEAKVSDQQQQINSLNHRINAMAGEMVQLHSINEKSQQENVQLKSDINHCMEEVANLSKLKGQFESHENIAKFEKEIKCQRDRASKFELQLDQLLNQHNTLQLSQQAVCKELTDLSTKFTKLLDVFKNTTKEVIFPKLKQHGEEIKKLTIGMKKVQAILSQQD